MEQLRLQAHNLYKFALMIISLEFDGIAQT